MDAPDMTKMFAAVALAAALAGCAGSNFDIGRRQEALRDYKGADAGFVVASEGGERGGAFDASGILFQRVGTEDLLGFSFGTRQMFGTPDHDFEAGSAIGKVRAMRLPPGDYDAYELHGEQYANGGRARQQLAPGQLRFTVKAGETTYIGRYVFEERNYHPRLLISYKQAEDIAVAKSRLPELPVTAVTSAVPPEGHRQF